MAEINWGLAQTPDYFGNALKYQIAGQERRDEDAKHAAMSQYATNPDGAINALMYLDPQAAVGLRKMRREDAKDAARTRATGMYAGGDTAGARQAALEAGDFDLATALGNMDEQGRKQAKERAGTLASVGYSLRQLPYAERKARLISMQGQFDGILTPQQLAGFDPTDANIDAQVAQALDLKDMLAERDRQADNSRAEAQLRETQRHNRVGEATAARNASTSAFSAQTGRMAFDERKKAGGFGTPGAGRVLGSELDPNDGW